MADRKDFPAGLQSQLKSVGLGWLQRSLSSVLFFVMCVGDAASLWNTHTYIFHTKVCKWAHTCKHAHMHTQMHTYRQEEHRVNPDAEHLFSTSTLGGAGWCSAMFGSLRLNSYWQPVSGGQKCSLTPNNVQNSISPTSFSPLPNVRKPPRLRSLVSTYKHKNYTHCEFSKSEGGVNVKESSPGLSSTYSIAQAGLQSINLLLQPSMCWNYMCDNNRITEFEYEELGN